ncbi:MAG: energy-coupling factor transporter transmembrane component T family protein [Promethearchaeota archaeon]
MANIHPVTKIAIVFILSIIAFILTNFIDLIVLLVFDIILIIITKIRVFSKKFRKVIFGFLGVNASIFIVWCFFSQLQGDITFFETIIVLVEDKWIWHVLITDQTISHASRISLRTIIMFFLMLFFFVGISDRDLIHGLRSIKVPFSVCLLINLTFRGISMFQQEYSTIKEAMMTRGVEFNKVSIPQKIKNFISIFIALIVLMFKKTEEMSNSIEARGIPIRSKNRTIYQFFPMKKKDYVILTLLIVLLIFSIYLNFIDKSFVLLILELF